MNPDISEMIHHPDTRDTSPAIVDLRAAMAPVPTSVAIATARDETGRMAGITLSSLTSVSLEPPLLLWCLRATSHSRPVFDRSSHFALNLLSDDQTELCERFGRPFAGDRFAGIDWHPDSAGTPLLAGCHTTFTCRRRETWRAGDHVVYLGEVTAIRAGSGDVMIFRDRALYSTGSLGTPLPAGPRPA